LELLEEFFDRGNIFFFAVDYFRFGVAFFWEVLEAFQWRGAGMVAVLFVASVGERWGVGFGGVG